MNSIKELSNEETLHLKSRVEYLQAQNYNLQNQLTALRDEYRKKVCLIRKVKLKILLK
jgi:predicted RNase H-like nuclease (RuvC/YqgF family)